MTDDDPTPHTADSSVEPALAKTRMEALSDGVLAFAMTLLVADLALRPPGSPLHQFVEAWPSYLVYLVSFLTIGGGWVAHNALTDDLDHVDRLFLRLNLLFLMLVAFLPFPTRLVGESLREGVGAERVATVVYGISLFAIRLLFFALSAYSRDKHLRRCGSEDADLRDSRKKFRVVAVGYVVTIGLSVVVPEVALLVYLALAVFLFVPFRELRRALTGGGSAAH